ncbi:prepilin, shufflon protein A [Pseudomonas mendocina]|nr:prepilin, shufflon protein A [Pseudomonas mendocina]
MQLPSRLQLERTVRYMGKWLLAMPLFQLLQTLICQSGVWRGSDGVKGQYVYRGQFVGSAVLATASEAAIVQVTGGSAASCGGDGENRYYLAAVVNGSMVAAATNANQDYSKTGNISFGVPANTSYTITSTPYNCPAGVFRVFEFRL